MIGKYFPPNVGFCKALCCNSVAIRCFGGGRLAKIFPRRYNFRDLILGGDALGEI